MRKGFGPLKRRLKSITSKLWSLGGVAFILLVWQVCCTLGLMPDYMLPSPAKVVRAFGSNFGILMDHARVSLLESFLGLGIGILLALLITAVMDRFQIIYKMTYPLLVITQAIPVVAIAPLLVLWLGYGMTPKVVLIVIVCFFPIAVGLLDGLKAADPDQMNLLRAMGAGRSQIFRHIKFPGALPGFFSGLKVSVSFSIIGAVVAEWLGGDKGLGVYMTRVRKSYAYDKMFAVIFLVIAISLLLMWLTGFVEKRVMPWKQAKER